MSGTATPALRAHLPAPTQLHGALHLNRRIGRGRTVLAVHGISSTHKIFNWLADTAPDLDLILPDLRGRGASVGLPDDYGLAQHAADLHGVIDDSVGGPVDVIANSFGGAVAVRLAAEYPSNVRTLTLLDGGLPLPGEGKPSATSLAPMFEALIHRLTRDWADVNEYSIELATTTSSLLSPTDPLLQDYAEYDLERGRRGGRVRVDPAAILRDAADLADREATRKSFSQIDAPVELLAAESRSGPGTEPLYPDAYLRTVRHGPGTHLCVTRIAGTDHAGIIMSRLGAEAAIRALRRNLAVA